MAERGTLVLVVGPSGAGKDALIAGARVMLEADSRYVFPRRTVSRAAGSDEDHESVNRAEFRRRSAAGGLALEWRAHGLDYGIPRAVEGDLEAGRTVIVNASRTVIEEARRRFPPVLVVVVTAGPAILRRRLLARGRESAAEIEERLGRAEMPLPRGGDVRIIRNEGPIEEAVARFLEILASLPTRVPAPEASPHSRA